MCRMYDAKFAECWVFQGKVALLKLNWTECAECCITSVFDTTLVQNVQYVGCRMFRMLVILRKTCLVKVEMDRMCRMLEYISI